MKLIFNVIYLQTALVIIILNLIMIKLTESVKGCVTFVAGEDYSSRHSICDRINTHLTKIPPTLPKEVVKLTINHQDIYVLDRKQLQHLPNLTYLNLDSNKLSVITSDAFDGVPLLKTLSLRLNKLSLTVKSFHPGSLFKIAKLIELNLMGNPIGPVPSQFFYPVRNSLKRLILSGASSEFKLTLPALEGLFNLELFDISYNKIETLDSSFGGLFSTMKLKNLIFVGNPLRCDCSLKWLRQWAHDHDKTNFFIHLEESSSYVPNYKAQKNDLEVEELTVDNIIEAMCASPIHLKGRSFFPIPGYRNNAIKISEMACAPKPVALIVNQKGKLGINLTLTCEFETSTIDDVFWFKDGQPLPPNAKVRVRHTSGDRRFVDLLIENLKNSDIGTYNCLIKNEFGKANSTINLTFSTDLWVDGVQSDKDTPIIKWISKMDTKLILKYTSIVALGFFLLLISLGFLIYCFFGRSKKNFKNMFSQPVGAATETSPKTVLKLRRIKQNHKLYDKTIRYSTSRASIAFDDCQSTMSCFPTFQDSHPMKSISECEINEYRHLNCPIHGEPVNMNKSEATNFRNVRNNSPIMYSSLIKTDANIIQCSDYGIKVMQLHDSLNKQVNTPENWVPPQIAISNRPIMFVEGVPEENLETYSALPMYTMASTNVYPCPRHGQILTPTSLTNFNLSKIINEKPSLEPIKTQKNGFPSCNNISNQTSEKNEQIVIHPTQSSQSSNKRILNKKDQLIKLEKVNDSAKKVEFSDDCQTGFTDEPGFITTV